MGTVNWHPVLSLPALSSWTLLWLQLLFWYNWTQLCLGGNLVQYLIALTMCWFFGPECKECHSVALAHKLFFWCSKHLSTADQNYSFKEPKPNEVLNSEFVHLLTSIWVNYLTPAIPDQSLVPLPLFPHLLLPPMHFFHLLLCLPSGHSATNH